MVAASTSPKLKRGEIQMTYINKAPKGITTEEVEAMFLDFCGQ